jgi:hypothetical protein
MDSDLKGKMKHFLLPNLQQFNTTISYLIFSPAPAPFDGIPATIPISAILYKFVSMILYI